jgi:hypothetical protein
MQILEYEIIEIIEWEDRVKECCDRKKKPENPPSGDCCYDTWTEEYEEVNAFYNQAEKRVSQLTDELTYMSGQRDMWKTWYDELTKVNDYSRKICHQLEIILHHIHRTGSNTHLTVKSINILYCMVRDFYMQLDFLKIKFTELLNCIKCLNNPELNSNQGIRALIDDYGKKLDIVISTRDTLVTSLISVIDAANRINKNIEHHFGLQTIMKEWKKVFNCSEPCGEEEENAGGYRDKSGTVQKTRKKDEDEIEDVDLKPTFSFPICNSNYYEEVDEMYRIDLAEADKISTLLLEETNERDKYKAWKEGLDAVIKATNPANRCATK